MNPSIKFKYEKDKELFNYINPILDSVCDAMAIWCDDNHLPFVITAAVSTKEEDKRLNRISTAHREGRAIDVSIHDWPELDQHNFQMYFNDLYKTIGCISKSDGHSRIVVIHNNGNGKHMHISLRREYAVKLRGKTS